MSHRTRRTKPPATATTPLLGNEFDPWYALLSPPESSKENSPSLSSKPSMPVRTATVDHETLAHHAELRSSEIVRDRWRDLRPHTPAERAAIVLSSKHLRAGNSLGVLDHLTKCLKESRRAVTFALPSSPFRNPNHAKVSHGNLDAGELPCPQLPHLMNNIAAEPLSTSHTTEQPYLHARKGPASCSCPNSQPFESWMQFKADTPRASGAQFTRSVANMESTWSILKPGFSPGRAPRSAARTAPTASRERQPHGKRRTTS